MCQHNVSIIIVTFNAEKTLYNALNRITAQTYPYKEIVIVDGGSSDETVSIIKQFDTEIITWISEPDQGIYDAMNKGIRLAKGKWLLFLGADDLLSEDILEEIFSKNSYDNIDVIYGKINLDNTTRTMGCVTDFNRMIVYNIPHQAIFYRKELLLRFSGYDIRYKILADYDLNLRIFERPEVLSTFIPKTITVFNSKGVSNRTIDTPFFTDKLSYFIREKKLSKNDTRLGKYYFFVGISLVLKKEKLKGLQYILHSIIYGERKFYYFMLAVNFLLTQIGFGRKFKYV